MLTVRLFCEASAAELCDPAIVWKPKAYSYFTSANRCKDFESKLSILANKADLVKNNDLNTILVLLSATHRFIFMKAVIQAGVSHAGTIFGFYLRYGSGISDIISAGLNLAYINWGSQLRKYPSDIMLYKDFVIKEYCGVHSTEDADKYIEKCIEYYREACSKTRMQTIKEDKYLLLGLSNYVGKECPVIGIKDWVCMIELDCHRCNPGVLILTNDDLGDPRFYDVIDNMFASGWIIDPFLCMRVDDMLGMGAYNMKLCLIYLNIYDLFYVFAEQTKEWRDGFLQKLDRVVTVSRGEKFDFSYLNDDQGVAVLSKWAAKKNPTKYNLWRKYRDRFGC